MQHPQQERKRLFEAEVLPHIDAAYRVALALTRQQADAEDLVQESVLRAFRGFAGFRPGSNVRAWLLTILRRQFLNDRRRAGARPLLLPLAEPSEQTGWSELPDTKTPGPEEQVLRTLDREHLLRALANVPQPYRAVVALVDLAELRYAEAAQVLRCPVGTVMSRLHRGRLMLAERLGATDELQVRHDDRTPVRRQTRGRR